MQISTIKYQLLRQFYGIEEFLDMENPLPRLIDTLDSAESEFSLWLMIKDLDIWFIRVNGIEQPETWDPLKEPLFEFANRHKMLAAHLYPERQIGDREIISYARECQTA